MCLMLIRRISQVSELDNDIEYCIKKSIVDNVPEYKNGIIKNL